MSKSLLVNILFSIKHLYGSVFISHRGCWRVIKQYNFMQSHEQLVAFLMDEDTATNLVTRKGLIFPKKHVNWLDFGLIDILQWKIFEFQDKPGLIFIVNPFTTEGQQYWIQKCLQDYTKKPNRLNLDPFNELCPDEDLWDVVQRDPERRQRLLQKLRWATLGYHHNWDTKEYNEAARGVFPSELAELTSLLAQSIGVSNYNAEAAIVNFYHLDSTLSGHRDVSEPDLTSPLFSISFGQSAIFLVGGEKLEDEVTAMFIKSGDIVVMSGQARLCYHGVPRIISTEEKTWLGNDWENTLFGRYLNTSRININVRQVLPLGEKSIKI